MKNNSIVTSIALLLITYSVTFSVFAANNIITVKGGTYTMDDTVQSIFVNVPRTTTFEKDTSTFGVEYDRMMNDHVSIGGGFQHYSIKYSTTAGTGDMDASFVTFNSKYHFTTGNFKPFVGGAAGFAVTDFTGTVLSGNTAGVALGLMAGFRWQFSMIGIYAEYKVYLLADTEDSANAEVDLAGDSVTAGLSIAF